MEADGQLSKGDNGRPSQLGVRSNHHDLEVSPSTHWSVEWQRLEAYFLLSCLPKEQKSQKVHGPVLNLAWYLPFTQTPLHNDPSGPYEDLTLAMRR